MADDTTRRDPPCSPGDDPSPPGGGDLGTIGTTVVEDVARRKGVDSIDLPPLYRVVDPDALEELFGSDGERPRPEGRVVFRYAGTVVAVEVDGSDGVTVDVSDGN